MSEENKDIEGGNRFFNLEKDRAKEALYRPPTLFKTTEWGLLTIVSMLAAFAFPPYFISVLWLAFLNAGGLLWVTHLSEKGRESLKAFEVEFSVGHRKEEEGKYVDAVRHYETLIPKYEDIPQIAQIAHRRISFLKEKYPKHFSHQKINKKTASRKLSSKKPGKKQ